MKRIFYSGLLALTIAFGVTSCDKNDVGEVNGPLTQVTKGITSKVSFGEAIGIKVKGAKNEAGKTAGEFDHIYSSVAQSIAITDSENTIVFRGSYEAGNIAGGITADEGGDYAVPIILQNGSYRAETMNEGGAGIGYLPYSSSADFVLSSTTGVIALQASLGAGFLIVNVEDALEGQRVTGTTVARQASGDGGVAGDAISLLEDAEFGDFYGYLPSESYTVVASYDLDGTSTPISASQFIAPGTAYTIELLLNPDTPAVVGSTVSTSTLDGLESAIGPNGAGNDINTDGDLLDTLVRIVTSTQATLNGVATDVAPVITNGPWSVVLDNDILVVVTNPESNEELLGSSVNAPADTDLFDTITRVVTTTTTSLNDEVTDTNVNEGDWTILGDYSSAGFGESVPDATDGDSTYDVREYSAWAPATAAADVETIDQTRSVTNVDGSFDPDVAAVLAQTIANDDFEADEADEFVYGEYVGTGTAPAAAPEYGAWVTQGASDSSVATLTQTRSVVNVTAAYSYEQTRTVEILVVVREDATPLDLSDAVDLTQTVNVPEARDAQADETQMIANGDYVMPEVNEDVSLSRSDFSENAGSLVWTGSGDAAGYSFKIFTAINGQDYYYQITDANGAGSASADFIGSDDDARYFGAVDGAIAAIQALING